MPESAVPVDCIGRARAGFPDAEIRFEVEFRGPADWAVLRESCRILEDAGVILEAMKATREGAMMFRLRDAPGFDPGALAAALERQGAPCLERWTIVVGFGILAA